MSNSDCEDNLKTQELQRLHKSNVELIKTLLKDLDCKNQVSILCKPLILVSSIICLIGCFFSGYHFHQVFFNDVSHSYLDDNFQSRNILAEQLHINQFVPQIDAQEATQILNVKVGSLIPFKLEPLQLKGQAACRWIAAHTMLNPDDLIKQYVGDKQSYPNTLSIYGPKLCTPKTNDPKFNNLIDEPTLLKHKILAYPIYHKSKIDEMEKFIRENKPHYDTMYPSETFGVKQFIKRLLETKQWAFYHPEDYYLDQDGFFKIGNPTGKLNEGSFKSDMPSEFKLSYNEMRFNAESVLSSPTKFINDCGFKNKGVLEGKKNFVDRGIFIGIVGPRFERRTLMDYQIGCEQMVQVKGECTPDCTAENFHTQTHNEFKEKRAGNEEECINLDLLRERYKISMELFLFDAQHRGTKESSNVYARIVGAGAGFFSFDYSTDGRHVTYEQLIRSIMFIVTKNLDKLSNIKVLDLFHFWERPIDSGLPLGGQQKIKDYVSNNPELGWKWSKEDNGFTFNGIKMIWTTNEMAGNTGIDGNMLLVTSNAMDSNSFPGNEYYVGLAQGSGEPAAAACSTIVWTQNPIFNPHIAPDNAVIYDSEGKRYKCEFGENGNCVPTLNND